MKNAKKELLKILKESTIKCALIAKEYSFTHKSRIILKLNYTKNDYEEFLKKLDFHYNSGFGTQELYGTVWLNDNTWLTRGEYDGSEWWEHSVLPNIPSECI